MSRPRAKEGGERGQSCTSIRAREGGVLHCESLADSCWQSNPTSTSNLCSALLEATANDDGPLLLRHSIPSPFSHTPARSPSFFLPLYLPCLLPQRSTKLGHTGTHQPTQSSIGCCDESERGERRWSRKRGRREIGGTTCSITFSSPHKLKGKTGALRSVTRPKVTRGLRAKIQLKTMTSTKFDWSALDLPPLFCSKQPTADLGRKRNAVWVHHHHRRRRWLRSRGRRQRHPISGLI